MGEVEIAIDGQRLRVAEHTSVAAAILTLDLSFRRSVSGEPRQALCGMGTCHECRVWIDGRVVRACTVPCVDGMEVATVG